MNRIDTLKAIVELSGSSSNDIIRLTAVLIIGIPLFILFTNTKSKERHARHKELMEREDQYREREKLYMDFISGNTAALVKLSTVLESNYQNCNECRAEQTSLYRELMDKQSEMHIDVIKIKERVSSSC